MDERAPLPATWALSASIVLIHGLTAWHQVAAGRAGWLDALLLPRPGRFLFAVGGQRWGAVEAGALWRLCTGTLLHGDALHLLVNTTSLLALGRLLEPWLSGTRWLAVFVLGGVGGTIASHLAGIRASNGASGGAYALLGVALVIGVRAELDPDDAPLLRRALPTFLVINLALSFVLPFVDAVAHIAGLLIGVGFGYALDPARPKGASYGERAAIGIFAVALAYGWGWR